MARKKNKKMVGVTCQCEEHAVARPASKLHKISCSVCGKIFQTNQYKDLCFACEKKNKE
jgi:hypothetical protein